ncbi:hypothetical protein CU097_004062, partial [Rhizopus azygosporus]
CNLVVDFRNAFRMDCEAALKVFASQDAGLMNREKFHKVSYSAFISCQLIGIGTSQ